MDFQFGITNITGSSLIFANDPAEDLRVWWYGTPVFPVTAIFYPRSCEPPRLNCREWRIPFRSKRDPLVLENVLVCYGDMPYRLVFDYAVKLVDAKGRATAPYLWPLTCRYFSSR